MAEMTRIGWCDSTFNGWIGCEPVSPGCAHCYADARAKRFGEDFAIRRRTEPDNWDKPLRWNNRPFVECIGCGWRGELREFKSALHAADAVMCPACHGAAYAETRRRVFSASLSDWLDNAVPIEWFVDLLDLVRSTPNLDWLLLSKRIGNFSKRLNKALTWLSEHRAGDDGAHLTQWIHNWLAGDAPANVWLGATVINQEEADRDIPKLLAIAARVHFLSLEPLLGPVDLSRWMHRTAGYAQQDEVYRCRKCGATGTGHHFTTSSGADDYESRCRRCGSSADDEEVDTLGNIDWVIPGFESDQMGKNARPGDLGWFRSLLGQASAAGVPVFIKQLGPEPFMQGPSANDESGQQVIRLVLKTRAGVDPDEWPVDLRVQQFPGGQLEAA